MNVFRNLMAGGCLAMTAVPALAQQHEKPNIIFIYADDMGYSDLACYGSTVNETPNLDRMAEEGMRFTDFYSGAPVSTPSRACLMTGRYPSRIGIRHVFFPHSFTGMSPEEVTMAEMLRAEGYGTALFGKWHLGTDYQYLPKRQGFDEFFGSVASIDNPPFCYVDGDTWQDTPACKDSTTITITNKALDYIERKTQQGQTFFCYVAYEMPHVPIAASPRFKGKSKNGLYGDVIMELDWGVGEILKKVKELGIDENTIIAFSSDNGPWLSEGPNAGCALPLYRGKGTTWDGGQRVPMIIRWKGHIKPGQVEESVAFMGDWFVTFATLTGGKIPTDRPIDGQNILPVLLNTGHRANQDFAYISSMKLEAYRSGDWKLKLPEPLKKGNYWQTDVPAHDTLLINLREDIGEQVNLKDKHPEIVRMLAAKMDSLKQTHVIADKAIFQWEMATDQLTDQQRLDAVLDAKKKGIGPKSKNGEAQLEFYEAKEKFQKGGGSIF